MQTYWHVSVAVDGRVVVSLGDAALSKALSEAIREAVYFQAIYPEGQVALVDIRETCFRCDNEGEVKIRRPRSIRIVRCPECKGKPATARVDDIPFRMPDSANKISLVAG